MKKSAFAVATLALAIAAVSCSDNKSADNSASNKAGSDSVRASAEAFAPTTNIRYYNMDTVMNRYEMVETFNEVNLRTMTELQNAEQSRTNEIQRMANSIQQKVQSNGYLSEASYNADVAALNQKQQQAQNYLGSLQAKAQQEALRQQQIFLDSLNNFLVDYNKTHHYDAILIYSPGELFNPALDITEEVVAGLNARYKKANTDKKADTADDTKDAKAATK